MHRKHKHDIIVILAVLGFGVSLYLSIAHYMSYTVPCGITHGCEEVLNSKYATLFGLPLGVWGVGYFTSVIISALLADSYLLWKKILTGLLGLGALAALVFLSLQFFVIRKICQYCLTVDLLSILLFILDINIEHRA